MDCKLDIVMSKSKFEVNEEPDSTIWSFSSAYN